METTYLLGAGINQSITSLDGQTPPLAHDLFRQALRHPRISDELSMKQNVPLFKYIEKYWHLTRDDLKVVDFDIEECFTQLELQRREAEISDDKDTFANVSRLEWIFIQLLLEFISECKLWSFKNVEFQAFGSLILREYASVITFNYDNLLESAIEASSQSRIVELGSFMPDQENDSISNEEVAYSPHEWNPYLAYKVHFDEVQLKMPGCPLFVDGERYYKCTENQHELSPFLKMHGSINWFYRSGHFVDGTLLKGKAASRAGWTLIQEGKHRIGLPEICTSVGEILLPIIITPVLNKPYDEHLFFRNIWGQARTLLQTTKRLIIGGYSFPATDFHVRRLLREAFSNNNLENLCIINPDTSIVTLVKNLCNFQKPVIICRNIGEFLEKES